MDRYKKLFVNIGIFGISNFASKILIFLMLPLYTRVLSTAELGTSDIIITATALALPIFSLGVYNSVLRFSMVQGNDKSLVFSYGLKIILIGFLVLIMFYPVFIRLESFKEYIIYFYVIYIMNCLNIYFMQFLRGLEQIKLIGIIGIVASLVTVFSNVILLVIFEIGIKGYLMSFALVNIVCVLIMFFAGRLYKYIKISECDNQLKTEMREYNIPLIPNSLSWWIIMMLNRYIVNYFMGFSAVGIFAVANRFPTIINVLYSIVQQALLLSVISDYEKDNEHPIFENIYNAMNAFLLICVVILSILIKPLALILFGENFYSAWEIVPLLLLAVFFGCLHGNLTTLFSANKNSKILFYNGIFGVLICIIFNLILIKTFQLRGAAFACLITYFSVWLHLLIYARRFKLCNIEIKQSLICYVIILIPILMINYVAIEVYYLSSLITLMIVIIVNYHIIKKIIYNSYIMFYSRIKNIC